MLNSKDFSRRLQKILDYYNISATAFSEEIDFSRSTISHLLSGRNKPSLEFVMKVLERFPEVELYWLLKGKGTFPTKEIAPDQNEKTTKSKNENLLLEEESKKSKPIFQDENQAPYNNATGINLNTPIERIVIFYKDGTFKEYIN